MKDFKKSVIYQIYPKSFMDSNGDGIGDLRGIIEKLNYLALLGVDYIWLTPIYASPQRDNGYDIMDYKSIDKSFGTMEDFEELVAEAKARGIDIMMDMVFNHTSTSHPWFLKSLGGQKEYKDYYIFKKPVEGREPTNWQSKFGGSAWQYVEELQEYYLHLFDVTQADLNWDNPRVRKELYKIIDFWIGKGVKGFRFDVINLISKPRTFLDSAASDGREFYTDGPSIHEYLKEMNRETFGKYDDIITVGEMSSTYIEACINYTKPENEELDMVFNFHHLKVDYKDGSKWTLMDFDFYELKDILISWQQGMEQGKGWNGVFWCNHDQPRSVSRFGDDKEYRQESAKMLATAIHMLRGTPFIYQGEEIAMANPCFDSLEHYRDVESINHYHILKERGIAEEEIINILMKKSRDNSRTPMQWSDAVSGGFTKGTPWIPLAPGYKDINYQSSLKDEKSVFYHYKRLIELRREMPVIAEGSFRPVIREHDSVFAYLRELDDARLLIINNFYGREVNIDLGGELKLEGSRGVPLIFNYEDAPELNHSISLRPYESIVYNIVK